MRRLTLILSDLYLPAEAATGSLPSTLALPALDALLRFSGSPDRIDDWRHWLARELGAGALAELPVAHAQALSVVLDVDGAWMATPVALEARLDHVRLRDRGLLRVSLDQAQALQVEFARTFGPAMSLQVGEERGFLLCRGPDADIATQDPARWLDTDIGRALPAGTREAVELRRLGTEIEMWLHSSPVNSAREAAGLPRISALWLWGGGKKGPALRGRQDEGREFWLRGSDPYITALHQLIGSEVPDKVPRALAEVAPGPSAFVELAPMSGPRYESLLEIERNWFGPARDALATGELDSFRLVANDRVFEVRSGAGWKFWRPRRHWLEFLRA